MCSAFDLTGNASSIHAEGRAARALVEAARVEIAGLLGARAENFIFTSGGTEALNLALTPNLQTKEASRPFDQLLIGAGEHAAVLAGHRFPSDAVETLALTPAGALDLAALEEALLRHHGRRVMLALQAANNETGAIQPVAAAAERVHAAGGFVVCDAAQGVGKIDCAMAKLGADALILSAHKFGGPQGVGGLCFADESSHISDALLRGGGQERGGRAGTENVAGVAGMTGALRAALAGLDGEALRLARLRDGLEAEVRRVAPQAVFFAAEASRLPNTSCFALPGVAAQIMLMFLDVEGAAVSSGSACSSGKVKASHVLAAMGVDPDLAQGAIRMSLGWNSSTEDLGVFAKAFARATATIKVRERKKGEASRSAAA